MPRKCPVCKFTFCPEDPDDRVEHRRYHRKYTHVMYPKPLKSLPPDALIEVRGGGSPDVRPSPQWLNKQLYKHAVAFRREFRYDFVQWSPFGEDDDEARGILITDEHRRVVGAMGFRWRVWSDAPAGWSLDWVWFVPSFRKQGYFTRHWKKLRQMYGDFYIQRPVSDAMRQFAIKQGDVALLR